MNTATRDLGVTISVKQRMMWHTVLLVGHDRLPRAVQITNDPLNHRDLAAVVMHKTASHGVAVQVARYVRRRFDISEPVETVRTSRAREAMIGYACTQTHAHPPGSYDDDVYRVVLHVSQTPVSRLLEEVAGGVSTARTRYVVYEVRIGPDRLRGVTHKFAALERRYREAPPDCTDRPVEIVQVGRYATADEARREAQSRPSAGDHLWTRKPDPAYVRRHLFVDGNGDICWRCDGSSAVRRYSFEAVCIGPHVYTAHQVRHVLEHGSWPPDGRTGEGRRLLASKV